jgi:hypothetical protein
VEEEPLSSLLLSSCNQWRVSLLHERVESSQVESRGEEKRHCGLARVAGLDTARLAASQPLTHSLTHSLSHSVTQSLTQSVSQSVSQSRHSLARSSWPRCTALLCSARDSTPDTCDPGVTHCHSTTPLLHYTTTPLHHYSTTPLHHYTHTLILHYTRIITELPTTPHHTTLHHTTLCAHYTFTPSLHTLTTLYSLHCTALLLVGRARGVMSQSCRGECMCMCIHYIHTCIGYIVQQ